MDEYSGDVLGTSVFSIVHGCSYFSGVTGLTVCPRYREVLYSLECIIKSFTVNSYTFWNVQLFVYTLTLVEQCIQTMWWVVHNSKAAIYFSMRVACVCLLGLNMLARIVNTLS